jgi:hypothetical protein
MNKVILNEPKGLRLFEMYTTLSHIHVASDTLYALPCLHFKQIAEKVISKVQQTLINLKNIIPLNQMLILAELLVVLLMIW